MSAVLTFLRGDQQAERAIPRRGLSAQLTALIAGALAFLAVFVLALSLSASRMADAWAADLTGIVTVQIPAEVANPEAAVQSVMTLLSSTPGVSAMGPLAPEEQQALLTPMLGADLPLDLLPLPQLIEVTTTEEFDATAVGTELRAVVPEATLDDHAGWRRPLVAATVRLRTLGWVAVGLLAVALLGLVTLAAQVSLASNTQTIGVLRLVGATDSYIAHAFMRRFMLRAFTGAAIGTAAGFIAMRALISVDIAATFGLSAPFPGWQALWLLTIPALSGLAALLATRTAARRVLKEVP